MYPAMPFGVVQWRWLGSRTIYRTEIGAWRVFASEALTGLDSKEWPGLAAELGLAKQDD
jgi:hypothetical protein